MRTALAALCAAAVCIAPVPANAVPIHHHVYAAKPLPDGGKLQIPLGVVVVDVAPRDSDDDGCRNSLDSYDGPGCDAPAPAADYSAIAPLPPVSSDGCPSYMAGEASSPDAVNPTSGASGCYQVTPGTQAAMGAACSDVNSSSCVSAICATQGNEAWKSSGATPCDYVEP